jgi:hypothetical protein
VCELGRRGCGNLADILFLILFSFLPLFKTRSNRNIQIVKFPRDNIQKIVAANDAQHTLCYSMHKRSRKGGNFSKNYNFK